MSMFKHHAHATSAGTIVPASTHTVEAPEIDPAGTVSAVTLLVLALLVILGRRNTKGTK